jgi:hypothetical protein
MPSRTSSFGFRVLLVGLAGLLFATALRLVHGRGDTGDPYGRAAPSGHERARAGASAEDGQSRPVARRSPPPRFTPGSTSSFKAAALQSFLPDRKATPLELYEQETRDPIWAPRMEQAIGERLSPRLLAEQGTPGLKFDKIECRSSSCRLEASWDLSDMQHVDGLPGSVRLDPLSWLTWSKGSLGTIEYRPFVKDKELLVPGAWRVWRRPDGRFATTKVVLFDESEGDPSGYAAAVEDRRARRMPKP